MPGGASTAPRPVLNCVWQSLLCRLAEDSFQHLNVCGPMLPRIAGTAHERMNTRVRKTSAAAEAWHALNSRLAGRQLESRSSVLH